MKALVTGATGFVGSHLVEALGRRRATITALVRSPGKAALLTQHDVIQIRGDLANEEALRTAVSGQDVVFHVAGLVAARNEAEFFRANCDGTASLLRAIQTSGSTPRLVLVSSLAAVGPAVRGKPLRSDAVPHPVTQYGRSKLAAEELVRGAALPWTIIRPPVVYGPRDREVLKVFQAARFGVAPIFGDGSQELSAVYAPDLAEALIAGATSPSAIAHVYHACHSELLTNAAMIQILGRALGRDRAVHLVPIPFALGRAALWCTGSFAGLMGRSTILTADKANEFFQDAWTGDPAALTRDTGWSAANDLASGAARTVAWYREAGWL
ncbi:MAG: NAD(P)-dependent oxidoreductase [Gemmatimonadota bacterium]